MKFPIERIVRYTTDDGVHVKCEEVGDLVRCKGCKRFKTSKRYPAWGAWCGRTAARVRNDDYCSWGEWREDGTN